MEKKGKLELTWVGKYEEEKLEPRILIEDKSKSYGDLNTENMLIHGDNLLALKALESDYTGKIKCVYIDPPYNTGYAFKQYNDSLEHSIWLSLMMKMIELDVSILVSGERKTDAELAMEKWIYNVLESSENKEDRKQFFDTSKYKSYLVSNNEKVEYIFDNFLVDKWLREDRKLNNYVHANGIRFVMDNYVYQNKKEDKDKELIETLQNITDIFLSLLSVIDSIKFHSSDYLDALEMEMKPQEGSQYWVCPIIVEYMNDRFDKKLLQYIQDNEGNGMQFMAEYYAD